MGKVQMGEIDPSAWKAIIHSYVTLLFFGLDVLEFCHDVLCQHYYLVWFCPYVVRFCHYVTTFDVYVLCFHHSDVFWSSFDVLCIIT